MFEDLVEVDLEVTDVGDLRHIPAVALIYGEYHGGKITTNCKEKLVFEAGRLHYNAHHIERFWKVKGYIPKNIKKFIIENIYDKEPFEYGKFSFRDNNCWYFTTDINTHTIYLIIPNCVIKGVVNAENIDPSGIKWNQIPDTECSCYSRKCSYTSVVLQSNIDHSNYSIECRKIIDKIRNQFYDYLVTTKNKIILTANGHNYGYINTELYYSECRESWVGDLTVYLPTESNGFIQPYLINKYLINSYINPTWGFKYYDVQGMKYRSFTFRGSRNEVVDKLNELTNRIKNELNSVSVCESYYILNNTGYYTILTDYLNQKPGFYKIELFIPTDETSLIRKDIMNSEKIVLGEKFCGEWGWLTPDKKFRYRSLELPNGNDYKKEIQVLI